MNPPLDPKELFDIPDPYPSAASAAPKALDFAALPPAPTRSRTWALRMGAVAIAIVCEAIFLGTMGLRSEGSLSPGVVGYGILLPLAGAVAAFAVLQPAASRRVLVQAVMGAGVFVFLVATLLARGSGDESLGRLLACVLGGTAMAVCPALLAVFAMRHAFVTGARWRTATVGLACGLVGVAGIRLHCPNDAFVHVLVGHGLPMVFVSLAAATLGTRFTRA